MTTLIATLGWSRSSVKTGAAGVKAAYVLKAGCAARRRDATPGRFQLPLALVSIFKGAGVGCRRLTLPRRPLCPQGTRPLLRHCCRHLRLQ
eukprot:scaffold13204_cov133-Isochrysis_galbana.AAC.3